MNKYLNQICEAPTKAEQGRPKIAYKRIQETDSFYNLSKLGQQELPQALQRRQSGRPPRLRISRETLVNGQPEKARIVKIPISNLHIYNPGTPKPFDCRISINLEVNLNKPNLHFDALIEGQTQVEVDRRKNRLSYKHLNTFSIDLTKVEMDGLAPTHELELEVDSNLLRTQMALMVEGRPNAYGDVVSGFLDNATFLMRARPPPQARG